MSLRVNSPTFNFVLILHNLEVALLADVLLEWWTNDELVNWEQKTKQKTSCLKYVNSLWCLLKAPWEHVRRKHIQSV